MFQKKFPLILLSLLILAVSCGREKAEEIPVSPWSIRYKKDFKIPEGKNQATVHYSPTCGCCKFWMLHMEEHGFILDKKPSENPDAQKDRLGVPVSMRSCHTALIGGYLIEGHVPAGDIAKLLEEKPDIAGLSVPQMPVGPPGMEGARKDPFSVIAFRKDGSSYVYRRYDSY